MAGSINKVFLVGRVGRDPEIRSMQDSAKIANLTLATSETWNDKSSGERKERTEWHRVVVLNDRVADVVERFVKKGALIAVEGSLQTRKWTDQQGQERYTTEVVLSRFNGQLTMLDTRSAEAGAAPQAGGNGVAAPRTAHQPAVAGGGGRDLDDEIPFGPCWQ